MCVLFHLVVSHFCENCVLLFSYFYSVQTLEWSTALCHTADVKISLLSTAHVHVHVVFGQLAKLDYLI